VGLRFGFDEPLRATPEQVRSFRRSKVEERTARELLPGTDRTKAEGDVNFLPPLVEMLQLLDGSAAGYGSVYRQLQPVRTVVDFIADSISSTPLKFYRREADGRPEAREHPVAELFRRPNPGLTPRRHIFGVAADLLVYGRAYDRFIPAGRGRARTATLVPLPPYRVTPKGGDLVQPAEYEFWSPDGSTPVTYGRDEVIDLHLYDPEDRRIGASKLQALRAILDEEVEASRNRRGFWKNSARVGGYIEYPFEAGMLTPDQLDRLRESVQGTHAGADNSGKTGVIERGGHFNAGAFSPKDSEFLEGRKFVLEATARVYNLPLALLSMTETATYASQREFHKQLYTEVLPPWYELIQGEIELQLFPWFRDTENLYAEFVTESKLRGDFLDQATVLNTAIGRPWLTAKEGRVIQNLPDRGVETDDDLVVPVGPNYALESLATAPAPPVPAELAVVASMPEEGLRRELVSFFDRQERAVVPKVKAGEAFHHERWNRQLAPLLGAEVAERVNLRTAIALSGGEDPKEVFDELRSYALEMARAATSQEVAG
jgi:HK97 family phage portal protein